MAERWLAVIMRWLSGGHAVIERWLRGRVYEFGCAFEGKVHFSARDADPWTKTRGTDDLFGQMRPKNEEEI